eukprot:6175790-Pleurochrysis_carterae.AAC.2
MRPITHADVCFGPQIGTSTRVYLNFVNVSALIAICLRRKGRADRDRQLRILHAPLPIPQLGAFASSHSLCLVAPAPFETPLDCCRTLTLSMRALLSPLSSHHSSYMLSSKAFARAWLHLHMHAYPRAVPCMIARIRMDANTLLLLRLRRVRRARHALADSPRACARGHLARASAPRLPFGDTSGGIEGIWKNGTRAGEIAPLFASRCDLTNGSDFINKPVKRRRTVAKGEADGQRHRDKEELRQRRAEAKKRYRDAAIPSQRGAEAFPNSVITEWKYGHSHVQAEYLSTQE